MPIDSIGYTALSVPAEICPLGAICYLVLTALADCFVTMTQGDEGGWAVPGVQCQFNATACNSMQPSRSASPNALLPTGRPTNRCNFAA